MYGGIIVDGGAAGRLVVRIRNPSMPENDFDQEWEEDLYEDYVPVAYGRDDDQATHLVDILNDHEIPAEVGELLGEPAGQGVPVLVPADLVDEATEIIENYDDLEGLVLADDEYEDEDEEDEEQEGFEEIDEEDLYLGDEEEEDEEEEEEDKGEKGGGEDDKFEFGDEDD